MRQRLYLAGKDERLYILDKHFSRMQAIDAADYSVSANAFFKDTENNLWIGSMGKGLYRLSDLPYATFGPNEAVFSISGDQEHLFFGTEDGILQYTQQGDLVKHVSNIGAKKPGKITALYTDPQHQLWIGSNENGLSVADASSFQTKNVEFSSIKNIGVNAITGRGDAVSVATNLDGVYNYSSGKLKDHFSVKNSLLHNNVYQSLISKNMRIYYATHNTSFNYSEGTQLYEVNTKALGLSSDFNAFTESSKGEVFIATSGDGLYRMRDTVIRPFEWNQSLDSKFCDGVICDVEDNVWIIERYHVYKYYAHENMLHEIKFNTKEQWLFNPGAYHKDANGNLFLGTSQGVLQFHKDTATRKLPQPYLVAVKLQDSLNKIQANQKLSNGVYHVTIEFSALTLKNSEDILFSYQLQGGNDRWSAPGTARKADFSKLGEGDYYFKVMAYNSEGFTSGAVTLYHFTIAAPYWKRPLFWMVVLVILVILVGLIIRWRTAKLIRDKKILEEQVLEKTKELREEKELVEKSNRRIEEQNQEIRDSITYARRIQDALLPASDLLAEKKNLFVLYQPRDIVSGDFYWTAEVNNLSIIAAADCTGHGVPGALMSMIGTTLLNKIVLERKITAPGLILKELDKEVRLALKQYHQDATRDGMDICLCCVNATQQTLRYAGAMRPLLMIRNHQLSEFDPTKSAIGGFSYGKEKEFTEQEIALEKNDLFYLFSDGYADQFGGAKGKKLMLKNFKKILVSISDLELSKQAENLNRIYANWKRDLEQVDDVLVIGFKI